MCFLSLLLLEIVHLPFDCGNLRKLSFPFTTPKHKCGMLAIRGCEDPNPNKTKTVQFSGKEFQVRRFDGLHRIRVILRDRALQNYLENDDCHALYCNITLPPSSPLGSFHILPNLTMYKCNSLHTYRVSKQFLKYTGCGKSTNETILFGKQDQDDPPLSLAICSRVQLPVNKLAFSADPFTFIASEFPVSIQLSEDCFRCFDHNKGICHLNSTEGFYCSKFKALQANTETCQPTMSESYPNDADPDSGRRFFGVPIISHMELQGAAKNFDSSNKLGDGGFASGSFKMGVKLQ
ncbi:uncharacterized protein LOC114741727 [Neltuma alba]|uniref:uncharacterized protein LOC114741727 n=1 Tax=Neltuma alba TaxID=207710 RepID=UPI0010A3DC91|nr:uncharacterized protein LOC114741727 [Prosopis alba]